MTTPVTFSDGDTQTLGTQSVRLSSNGSFSGSRTAWIIDACSKLFRVFRSPSKNYGIAAKCAEAQMDFNGQGGLVVGLYGVAEGLGTTNKSSVNDVVGVHGTAHKRTDCWAAGVHADVYDYAPGGIGIGVNVEFPVTQKDNRYIGVNVQPNPEGKYEGLNLQGKVTKVINTQESQADVLLALGSGSPMWVGNGSPGGALGNYAGSLKIVIDGGAFHIPVYK